jgi:hypothetical protein
MKTKLLMLSAGTVAIAAFMVPRIAEGQPPVAHPKAVIEWPLGAECVVTVQTQAWMNTPVLTPGKQSGFESDYTLKGKVVYWGADWIVLKDGTYENWISRDKVLTVRASR